MIVETLHPAVCVHVPARARAERMSLVAMRTPVEIPAAPRSAFHRIHDRTRYSNEKPTIHRSDEGGAWRRLTGRNFKGTDWDASAAQLKAWLEGDPDAPLDFSGTFRGTPVAAWGHAKILDVPDALGPTPRGERVDVDASRAVSRDDRATAPAAVSRFLAERVRVVGDEAWLRVAPVLGLQNVGYRDKGRTSVFECKRPLPNFRTMLASPLSMDAAYALKGYPRPADPHDVRALQEWLSLDIAEESEERACRAFLDAASGMARVVLDYCLADFAEGRPEAEGLAAARRAVRSLELDALTGSCGAADPVGALETVSEALRLCSLHGRWGNPCLENETARADLDAFYLPQARLAAERRVRPVPDEDMDGLALAAGIGR